MDLQLDQLELKFARLRGLDQQRQRSLMRSLTEGQQQVPVLVIPTTQAHRWILIDGYARVTALSKLGRDTVRATSEDLSEDKALIHRQRSSQAHRSSALEEGWLVRELIEGHRYDLADVGRELGRSTSWVSRRLGLVKSLPQEVQDAVCDGRMCAYGAMKHLLPLARANMDQCKTLVTALGTKVLTSRQLGLVVQAWKAADATGRTRIVSDPLAVLRLQQQDKHGGQEPSEALRGHLRLLRVSADRAHKHVQDFGQSSLRSKQAAHLWKRACFAFESLQHAMQEFDHAGS